MKPETKILLTTMLFMILSATTWVLLAYYDKYLMQHIILRFVVGGIAFLLSVCTLFLGIAYSASENK